MWYRLCADIAVATHTAFVVFAVFGGLVALRWRKVIWLHVPAVLVAALAEFTGWICPLTPLENWFRVRGGEAGYTGSFIEHYIVPVLYPTGLTRRIQVVLGTAVVMLNLLVYAYIAVVRLRRKADSS